MLYVIIVILIITVAILSYRLYRAKLNRKKLEAEVFTFRSVVDNFPDFVYFKDKESKFTYINKSQAKLLNIKYAEEAIGKTDVDFFEDGQELYKNDQQIMQTQKAQINFVHPVCFQGEKIFISDTKIPLYDKEDNCIGTIGISRDISKLRQAESESTENKIKYQAIFENAPMAIFYADSENLIIDFNRRFKELFKCDFTAKNSISINQILSDKRIAQVVTETVLATNEANFELVFVKNDKSTFIGNLTLTVIKDGTDQPLIEGIIEDISSMVKARDEIISAKDNAIKANHLKSHFLANLSHEIRTPVNAIIGFSDMLADVKDLNDDNKSFLEIIKGNSVLLLNLIDSIIDFSKMEANQLKISNTTFNFQLIFNELAIQTQRLLLAYGKTNIKLNIENPSSVELKITSDRDLLKQAIVQLLMNAVKFTNSGEILFKYEVTSDKLKITVRDTGIGILNEDKETIFHQFVKGSNTKGVIYEGTGIGLTLTSKILEMLDAKLLLSSRANSGTEFVIILKL